MKYVRAVNLKLDREFDLVFIHDAIMYLTTRQDLENVFEVARNHLKEGGFYLSFPTFLKRPFGPPPTTAMSTSFIC